MIQQTSYLGIPIDTQRRRRLLVCGYYAMILGLCGFSMFVPGKLHSIQYLIPQTIVLGGLFGGITYNGPVKRYDHGALPIDPGKEVFQELNLSGRRPFQAASPLDEREIVERNQAHYTAYRLLRIGVVVAAAMTFLGMGVAPERMIAYAPTLLWLLLITVLSLPQSVILWTEPDPLPDQTLTLLQNNA